MIHMLLVVMVVVGQVHVQAAFIPVEYATDATWIYWTSTLVILEWENIETKPHRAEFLCRVWMRTNATTFDVAMEHLHKV
jgi:hypothetical protein